MLLRPRVFVVCRICVYEMLCDRWCQTSSGFLFFSFFSLCCTLVGFPQLKKSFWKYWTFLDGQWHYNDTTILYKKNAIQWGWWWQPGGLVQSWCDDLWKLPLSRSLESLYRYWWQEKNRDLYYILLTLGLSVALLSSRKIIVSDAGLARSSSKDFVNVDLEPVWTSCNRKGGNKVMLSFSVTAAPFASTIDCSASQCIPNAIAWWRKFLPVSGHTNFSKQCESVEQISVNFW